MKKIAAIILAVLFETTALFAHEMEGGSTKGLFGLKPEYLHVLLNPLPVYGLALAVLVLAGGLFARSRAARNIGLVLIVLCAASAWPVLFFGQHGYNHLYPQLDPESQQWLNAHMERAERFIYAFYLTALLGIAALVVQKKFPKANKALTLLTLLAAIASLGIGGWISRAGGEVSHSEFRGEEAPPSAPIHDRDTHGQPHDEMQTTNTSGGHQHETTNQPKTEKSQTPDTPEGIWKSIHEHRGELESAVNLKKFDEVQTHAVTLRALAKKLAEVAQPDRKSVVESGASKMDRALDELKKSAETGSEMVMKNNFKEFEKSLDELEQQVNKP